MPSTINATPTSSGLVQSADASGVLALQTGGTTAVTIDGSQNVGIGTTSPARRLTVKGSTGIAAERDIDTDRLISTYNNINCYANATGAGNHNTLSFTQSNNTETVERMRIDSSGTLRVGNTSGSPNPGVLINPDGSISQGNSAGGSGYEFVSFRRSGTQIGIITQNGTTAVSYNTSSDYRLKENIAPMTGALGLVQQLKPVTYDWKADGSSGQGFIAHELQAVVPDCVTGEKDAVNEDGSIKTQGIDTSFLVATLTAAIQEQQALITQLQADVAALKVQP